MVGTVEYARTATVPTDLAPGRYDVVVGLWDLAPRPRGRTQAVPGRSAVSSARATMLAGSARWKSRPTLPYRRSPAQPEPGRYTLTFDEDFTAL